MMPFSEDRNYRRKNILEWQDTALFVYADFEVIARHLSWN